MIQQNFFGQPKERPPHPPKKLSRPTSQITCGSVAEDALRIRELIWDFLNQRGDHDATDAEIQEAIGSTSEPTAPCWTSSRRKNWNPTVRLFRAGPCLFGKSFTLETTRRDPVCRRLLLTVIADFVASENH